MAEVWDASREAEAAEIAKGSQLKHSEFIGKFDGEDRNEARKAVWAARDKLQAERAQQGAESVKTGEALAQAREVINNGPEATSLTQRFGKPERLDLSVGQGAGLIYRSSDKGTDQRRNAPAQLHKDRPDDPTGRSAELYN